MSALEVGQLVADREQVRIVDRGRRLDLGDIGREDEDVTATPELRQTSELMLPLGAELLEVHLRVEVLGIDTHPDLLPLPLVEPSSRH